jgi:hypothetical protein
MSTPPFVLVSLVSTGDAIHVANCLECLATSSHQRFAVFINENGGETGFKKARAALSAAAFLRATPAQEDGVAEYTLQPFGQRIVLRNAGGNVGYAGGTNAALYQTDITCWDAVWVLNPDTFPERDALAALISRQAEGDYGIVGSRLIFVSSGLVQTWGGQGWKPWLGRGKLLGFRRPADERPDDREVEDAMAFVSGASMYATRAYVDAVGGMDDEFFVFCEDVEWCLRGRDRFKFGYAHDSVVRHIHGGTAGSSQIRARRSRFNVYLTERNKVLLARKRLGIGAPLAIGIYLAGITEHLLRDRSIANFRTAIEGWIAGVRRETGPPPWMQT